MRDDPTREDLVQQLKEAKIQHALGLAPKLLVTYAEGDLKHYDEMKGFMRRYKKTSNIKTSEIEWKKTRRKSKKP